MHNAYSAALASFRHATIPEAQQIWFINERLVDFIFDAIDPLQRVQSELQGQGRAGSRRRHEHGRWRSCRGHGLLLRVDRWSRQDLERSQLRGAAEPVMKYARRKLPSSLFE